MAPFANSAEHLQAELERLDVLLQRELSIARLATPRDAEDEFRGLVITEGEIEALAQQQDYLAGRWKAPESLAGSLEQLDQRADSLRRAIEERAGESQQHGVRLALVDLAARTGLSRREVDLLLLAIAPELEPRYETLYAYIQNDVTRKRPSVDLALNLVSRTIEEKLEARRLLRSDSPLRASRLIALGEESFDRQPTLLRRFLRVEDDVVFAVLDAWVPLETDYAAVVDPAGETAPDVDPASRDSLDSVVRGLGAATGLSVVRLVADSNESLHETAEWIAWRLRRPLLAGATDTLARDPERWNAFLRNAILGGSVIALSAELLDETAVEQHELERRRLWHDLRRLKGVVLLLGQAGAFRAMPAADRTWHLDVPRPDFARRRTAWRQAVGEALSAEDSARLADSFHFGRSAIVQTAKLASSLAEVRHPRSPQPQLPDLLDAGRILTTPQLRRFAVRVEPHFGWEDIILPRDKADQLRRIASWKRFRHQVFERWGFGQKLSRGKGLNVLFSGASGTGKTMAAEVLARDLALDLFQIDLSSVVSKYVGETEKHLDAIFREAADTQSLLFFDEADALFGKRTEVKDAHDRYANIEINFLLQRIEQFEGIVILATNMRRNLDDAFLRRLTDVVDFPFPDEALRERIWRGHFPAEEIRARDVDCAFLAKQFKVTGGNIKNIVLDAAFRAAEDGGPIAMRHLIFATRAELQKEGRLPSKSEFGPYFELVQPAAPPNSLVGS